MKKIVILISVYLMLFPTFTWSQAALGPSAKILVISDIDDTLKVASSRNNIEFVALMNNTLQYTGMSELFEELNKNWGAQIQFSYVTNAPHYIESSRKKFLAANKFQPGLVFYSPKLSDETHKYLSIRKLLTDYAPTHVIFLGDNSSRDSQVYVDIATEYRPLGIQFHTFIHRMYKDRLIVDDSQYFSYITSIEVAKKLYKDQLMNKKNYDNFFNLVYPQISSEIDTGKKPSKTSEAFPRFTNCVDFKWSLPLDLKLLKLQAYLLNLCK
jgi:Uncharacterized conserved protein (DUF2183)